MSSLLHPECAVAHYVRDSGVLVRACVLFAVASTLTVVNCVAQTPDAKSAGSADKPRADQTAADKATAEKRRAVLLTQMRERVALAEITVDGVQERPKLVDAPVFRYDDQQRRFIDATMWVWTINGRPVAFQKLEAQFHWRDNSPEWGYCFGSASPNLLTARWPGGPTFRSTAPGVVWQAATGAPAVADRDTARKRQARELARSFTARAYLDAKEDQSADMRLLTTPIYEYSDPATKQFLGAVYGYSSNGTNPDLLIAFEMQKRGNTTAWMFAPIGMTASGVKVKRNDMQVWEKPYVLGGMAPFPTWTFFGMPRDPLPE